MVSELYTVVSVRIKAMENVRVATNNTSEGATRFLLQIREVCL